MGPTDAVTSNERSIAVLPFINVSGDEENEYFSDGISDEILNNLARLPQLGVARANKSRFWKLHGN